MRIGIFGAGAVGGHLAAKLAASGHDVSVVARGAHLQAMRDNGIKLIHGDQVISASVRTRDPGLQDFVFVTLKANLLGFFAENAAPLLGKDTGVVFAQNGIPWWYGIGLGRDRPRPPDLSKLDPQGRLARAISAQNIIGGVVYSANEVREPGVIVNHVPGNNMLVVGRADDADSSKIQELRSILGKADLSSPPGSAPKSARSPRRTASIPTARRSVPRSRPWWRCSRSRLRRKAFTAILSHT